MSMAPGKASGGYPRLGSLRNFLLAQPVLISFVFYSSRSFLFSLAATSAWDD